MDDYNYSPFAAIISGDEPGVVLARDEEKRFALIESIHPEGAIHWLAVPYEAEQTTEELATNHRERFLDLVDFAITQTRQLATDNPRLDNGFTIKFHFGSFETVRHAKLHVLSTE
jgi:histidine triad (HIT) family protein